MKPGHESENIPRERKPLLASEDDTIVRPDWDGDEDGMVELYLMGGGASPANSVDPSLDLSFGGAVRAAPCPRKSLASGQAAARLRAGAAPGD